MKLRWPLMWKSTHEAMADAARPRFWVERMELHPRGIKLTLLDRTGFGFFLVVDPTHPGVRQGMGLVSLLPVSDDSCEIVQEPMQTYESEVRAIAQAARKAGDPYVKSDDLPPDTFPAEDKEKLESVQLSPAVYWVPCAACKDKPRSQQMMDGPCEFCTTLEPRP